MTVRIRAAAVVSFVIPLVVAGVALAAPSEPVARHVPADMVRAQQLVLALSDLGNGWVAEKSTAPGAKGGAATSALRCAGYDPDLSGLVETGSATGSSFSFDDGNAFYSVGSSATVMRTQAMTTTAWDRSIRPEIVSCFRGAFVRGLQLGSGAGIGGAPRVSFGASRTFRPSATTTRRIGFRLTATILFRDKGATPLPVVIDVVFLSQGRHLSFATIASLGESPPPALEREVTGRLAARLQRDAARPGPSA